MLRAGGDAAFAQSAFGAGAVATAVSEERRFTTAVFFGGRIQAIK